MGEPAAVLTLTRYRPGGSSGSDADNMLLIPAAHVLYVDVNENGCSRVNIGWGSGIERLLVNQSHAEIAAQLRGEGIE